MRDTMEARSTILHLFVYLLIGWVVWIIVNFIEKNCLVRLLLVTFVIRHISSSHLTNQTCTSSNLKELHHGFIKFISWQILLAMVMIVGDSHLKLISSTILQERTGERNIVHVKGYNSRQAVVDSTS